MLNRIWSWQASKYDKENTALRITNEIKVGVKWMNGGPRCFNLSNRVFRQCLIADERLVRGNFRKKNSRLLYASLNIPVNLFFAKLRITRKMDGLTFGRSCWQVDELLFTKLSEPNCHIWNKPSFIETTTKKIDKIW